MSKKIVLKVDLNCVKCQRKVMKTVAGIAGVDSVQVDAKEEKITVIGDADPVYIINKLRKFGRSELLSVGPAKEPDKTQSGKKPDEKKDDKKDAPKKDDPPKGNPNPAPANITYVYPLQYREPYRGYRTCLSEENPNACCIS